MENILRYHSHSPLTERNSTNTNANGGYLLISFLTPNYTSGT